MHTDKIVFQAIGVIHSPHKEIPKTPIQPVFCDDIAGTVIVNEEYAAGLQNLDGFSHIYLFYYFNRSRVTRLRLKPYLSDRVCGVFATRAPHRPNKIGMSLVRLDKIEANILYVRDIDILDGTPLLDIKPYIGRFDSREDVRSGWQDRIENDVAHKRGQRDYEG